MMAMRRWRTGAVLVIAGVLGGTAVPALAGGSSSSTAAARAIKRCERTLLREGAAYANHVNWSLVRCIRQVNECKVGDTSLCERAPDACVALASDLAYSDRRLTQAIQSACGDVAPDQLRARAGGSCTMSNVNGFAGCLLTALRTENGRMVRRMNPAACNLLAMGGIRGGLPAEICAAEATCPVCPTCQTCPECPAVPDGDLYCGGADGVQCPAGMVCDRTDALCSSAEMPGRCVPAPAPNTCTSGAAVCGCDGHTYGSDCERLAAGAVKEKDGVCDPGPQACGVGMADCPSGSFCDYSIRGDCGESGAGLCRVMSATPCDLCSAFVSGPICGCDMVTYPDECAAAAAGVSRWFNGSCPQ